MIFINVRPSSSMFVNVHGFTRVYLRSDSKDEVQFTWYKLADSVSANSRLSSGDSLLTFLWSTDSMAAMVHQPDLITSFTVERSMARLLRWWSCALTLDRRLIKRLIEAFYIGKTNLVLVDKQQLN